MGGGGLLERGHVHVSGTGSLFLFEHRHLKVVQQHLNTRNSICFDLRTVKRTALILRRLIFFILYIYLISVFHIHVYQTECIKC